MRMRLLLERWMRPLLFVFLLAGMTLACNTPGDNELDEPTREQPAKEVSNPTATPKQAQTAASNFTPGSPATVPIVVETSEAGGSEGTESDPVSQETVTFEVPTLAMTPTATSTATRRPPATSTPGSATGIGTVTPSGPAGPGDPGPLTFTFTIEWRFHPTDPMEAIARVAVYASGGGGGYRYYIGGPPGQGGIEQEGSVFEYQWRVCKANPQSLTVTSRDGQLVTQNYYEDPPCPTPTPTP